MNLKSTLLISMAFISFSVPVYAETKHHGHAVHQDVKISKKTAKLASVKAYRAVMKKMHRDMAVAYSGDADIDFVRGMIPHHQGAVDMANIQLKYGKDEQLKELSRRIILAQQEEIGFMSNWLRGRDIGFKYADAKTAESTVEYEKAMADMHKNMAITYVGDADIDFASGMIPHHQGAIDMAWILKEHGSNSELRPMIDDIISSQSQEIELMKEWLKKKITIKRKND